MLTEHGRVTGLAFEEGNPMHTEEISYEAEGTTMIGHLALPDGDDVCPVCSCATKVRE